MKKIFNFIMIMLAAVLILPACSKDHPFDNDDDAGKARSTVSFKKIKNDSEVNQIETIVRSNDTGVDLSAFVVEVSNEGKTYYNGTLAEMPEVMTLPVGQGYKVTVHSPENPASAWDAPYYEGTQTFDVKEAEITYVDPVVCKLANVKVSINFDPELLALMEDDCKVVVETGSGATLTFSKNETRSGFFRYEEADGQSTLVATFSGTVDENYEENFRTYTAVAPGNHYIISYRLHGLEPEDPDTNGKITLGVLVDSSVTKDDLTVNIDHEDPTIPDTDRPTQGDPTNPPTPPGPDEGDAPTLKLSGDLNKDSDWDISHVVPSSGMAIKVKAHSDHKDGLTVFTVDIISDTLTKDILEADGVGLTDHLDLVNPGKYATGLQGLGFPVYVGGQQDPDEMDITQFTSLLGIFGPGTHKFKITVGDGYGTTVKTLTLISE